MSLDQVSLDQVSFEAEYIYCFNFSKNSSFVSGCGGVIGSILTISLSFPVLRVQQQSVSELNSKISKIDRNSQTFHVRVWHPK